MKSSIIIIILSFFFFQSVAQNCLPNGIVFQAQAEVDNFSTKYAGCTTIIGNVSLGNGFSTDNILNVDGLNMIDSIGGYLATSQFTPLSQFEGFTNLRYIGGHLILFNKTGTFNFHGLERLKFIGGKMTVKTDGDFEGLDSLETIGGKLTISKAKSFVGLERLTTVREFSVNNVKAKNLEGLNNLTTVERILVINNNDSLQVLKGLDNLESIGGLWIFDNVHLSNLNGLQGLKIKNFIPGVLGKISIKNNPELNYCDMKFLCDAKKLSLPVILENNGANCSDANNISCLNKGISGTVFYDVNQNKIYDENEFGIDNQAIQFTPSNELSLTNESGWFFQRCDSATTYNIAWVQDTNWILTTDTVSYNIKFEPGSTNNLGKEFGLYPKHNKHHGLINLTSNPPRCNTKVDFFVRFLNDGTFIESGKIILQYDPKSILMEIPGDLNAKVDSNKHTITWPIDSISPFDYEEFKISFLMPNESLTGQLLSFSAQMLNNNSDLLSSSGYRPLVLCSYDPNDKNVQPPGEQVDHYTLHDEKLTYTIRFQNTGNAEAIDIKILDTIDTQLDINTLRVVNSSFPVEVTRKDQAVAFNFRNIWLQDSTHNEPESHGFVTYDISPIPNLPDYSVIENTAHIIFDFNPAIITNTAFNTMVTTIPVGILETNLTPVVLYPNPTTGILHISTLKDYNSIRIINLLGEVVFTSVKIGGKHTIDVSSLNKGVYFVHLDFGTSIGIGKFIKNL